ncbi:MAG: F0F1 ATP synthase subunit A [Lachnospirales bacterium]
MDIDFNNKVLWVWNIFGEDLYITESIRNTWLIGLALIIFAIIVRVKIKNFEAVPNSKFQNIVELIVETFHNFSLETMDERFANYGFWFFGVICFIAISNISGLIGLRPPTSDLAVTLTFALCTFVIMHVSGILISKSQYFKDYVSPMFIFLPLNIISEIATPVSLGFRLFGNILSGTIIMALIYGMLPTVLTIGLPAFLHMYFDIFAGLLQSYIFVILSMTFIRQKLPE